MKAKVIISCEYEIENDKPFDKKWFKNAEKEIKTNLDFMSVGSIGETSMFFKKLKNIQFISKSE